MRETVRETIPAPLQDLTSLPGHDRVVLHKPRVPKNHVSGVSLQNQEMNYFFMQQSDLEMDGTHTEMNVSSAK